MNKEQLFADDMRNIMLNMRKHMLNRKSYIKKYNKYRKIHADILESMASYILDGKYDFGKYIREINNRLKNNMKIKIINCYKFTDFEINSREILENHGNIVNTKGEYKISDIFNKKIVKNPVLTK